MDNGQVERSSVTTDHGVTHVHSRGQRWSAAASSEGVIAWAASRWTVHIANAGDRGLPKDGKMTDKDVAEAIKQYRIDVEKMKRDGA